MIVDVPWTVFGAIVTFVTDGEPGITNELTELYSSVSGLPEIPRKSLDI